ncbi:MAG: 16S rRNA (cytosine(1402)-N(4))-methyltransferase RsmH, partial [Clostridia bacterium]|nr:16S rRNA (cytosine(1402)-N(4))-methyltransferase RsmH [Clostridia bacterium]
MKTEFHHESVLADECLKVLRPEVGGVFVDCTAGGGGHSLRIASALPEGSRLVSIDRDEDALAACRERLKDVAGKVTFVKGNFEDVGSILDGLGIEQISGILWDLGVSSYQLDEAERGFSYQKEAPLDMRMDRSAPLSARDVVNGYDEERLRWVLWTYGEEKFAPRIARGIVESRTLCPIETTTQLSRIVSERIPEAARKKEAQHPAKRTF